MANILPEVDITPTNPREGTVTVVSGETKGKRGRTVVLQATPADGYTFDGWEIETSPVGLSPYMNVSIRFDTLESVCLTNAQQSTRTPVFSDGTTLYTDRNGEYQLATGFYQPDGYVGSYIRYTGAGIPAVQTCPPVQSITGGGGGFTNATRGFGGTVTYGGFTVDAGGQFFEDRDNRLQ